MPLEDAPKNPQEIIFSVEDPEGRLVGINQAAWHKICILKQRGISQDSIKETIRDPEKIYENADNGSLNYAVYVRERKFYRVVCAKFWPTRVPPYLVATAFSRSLPPSGRIVWQKPAKP